jgi:hypothetical protein
MHRRRFGAPVIVQNGGEPVIAISRLARPRIFQPIFHTYVENSVRKAGKIVNLWHEKSLGKKISRAAQGAVQSGRNRMNSG